MLRTYNLMYVIGELEQNFKGEKNKKSIISVLKHFSPQEFYFSVANKDILAKKALTFEAKYLRKDTPAASGCSFTGVFIPYQVVELYPNMKIVAVEYVKQKIKPPQTQKSVRFKLQVNDENMYGLELFLKPQKR